MGSSLDVAHRERANDSSSMITDYLERRRDNEERTIYRNTNFELPPCVPRKFLRSSLSTTPRRTKALLTKQFLHALPPAWILSQLHQKFQQVLHQRVLPSLANTTTIINYCINCRISRWKVINRTEVVKLGDTHRCV